MGSRVIDIQEVAWAAGFFDGEGCTTRSSHRNGVSRPPNLTVTQVDRRSLERFQAAVAGMGVIRAVRRRADPRQRDQHVWVTTNWIQIQAVIALLWKFLGPRKREQAHWAFRVWIAARVAREARRMMCRNGHPKAAAGERCRRCAVGQTLGWRAKNRARYTAYMREYGRRRTASRQYARAPN